ncbi:CDP-glycerol glycerophosphotransferase family protein [Nocardioides sp. Iso805N]|uniref:CDP-glycerol glycerophosphotransferase family protein n=1 Tax=Nocardioides sp. Iso805N TaxID=1283287 RepID=UPI0003648070|nr:CDP-glycerol glycerophosphotransferase family protein [Nocardioides sp. Iso805N]
MSAVLIHLEYPFHDVASGAGVLAAALALFGAGDPVELVLSARSGMPGEDAVGDVIRLWDELALPHGEPPVARVVDAETAAALPAIARLEVTGEPGQDARTILMLGSIGRRFGSAYGAGTSWLRGTPELIRTELDASARARQIRAVHRPTRPLRFVVMVQHIQVWSAVDSIVRAALERPDVELDVVLVPEEAANFQQHPREEVEAFVASRGVRLRDAAWLRGRLADLDVLVVPDPYIARWNTPPGLSPQEIAESGVRLVLAPYAQALSGDPVNLGMLHNQPLHNMAWRIFAPSRGAVANFARCCRAGTDHIRYVGSAKRERLLTDEVAAAQATELRRALRTQDVVLWNPHFVGDRRLSTFQELVEPILRHVAEHPSLGLVVRPHPRLIPEYLASGLQEHVDDFRVACAQLPNVVLDESMDATPALLAADAMISDLSSLVAEYHVLGRPIGLLRPGPGLALNEDQDWLEVTTAIDDEIDLVRFLDPLRRPARATAPGQDDLGAGARIIEAIVRDYRDEVVAATSD